MVTNIINRIKKSSREKEANICLLFLLGVFVYLLILTRNSPFLSDVVVSIAIPYLYFYLRLLFSYVFNRGSLEDNSHKKN